jgi:hypothetical protein
MFVTEIKNINIKTSYLYMNQFLRNPCRLRFASAATFNVLSKGLKINHVGDFSQLQITNFMHQPK